MIEQETLGTILAAIGLIALMLSLLFLYPNGGHHGQ